MAKFFIDRPVFAIVIAIVIVLLGAVAIPTLPVATYPEVVPPVVQITANYRGGNSLDLEKTVAQPIEQQLTALDGMLYFFSRSSNNGALTIDVTFELGTDVDLATVKVQNKVSVAMPQLPQEVQREGVTVKKVSSAFLFAIGVSAEQGRYDALFLNNFATINLVDKIGSLPGVGDCRHAALGKSRQDGGTGRHGNGREQRCTGPKSSKPGGLARPAAGRSKQPVSISGKRERASRNAGAV
jgi:multidrug efflux pump subunit AcrB